MSDHEDEIEQLTRLVDEVREGIEAAVKVKKISDQIIKILEHVDESMALTIATVVAGRVISSVAKNGVAAKCMSATMHARIYEFVHMNFDDEEEDDEEQILQ
jgi:uncharacterized protein (UPF0147 family)